MSSLARYSRILFLTFSLLVLPACAVAPMQEMSNARQAVEAAHDASAGDYAPENMRRAEQYLEQASQAVGQRAFRAARRNAMTAGGEARRALDVKRAIEQAEHAIDVASHAGRDVSRSQSLLSKARLAADKGDAEEAISVALKAGMLVITAP